ncbi:hypothetical protein AVEN_178913-1 [Araneus ventricosus]|uniref:Uncharacterized protein n=1 Tax=Araneus ventricosus TaxID=182803 RepID=A0A4Y2UMP3_ARAVE|nr:hypothetical protein AVEN_178913-1 [Araneus ventricosus]
MAPWKPILVLRKRVVPFEDTVDVHVTVTPYRSYIGISCDGVIYIPIKDQNCDIDFSFSAVIDYYCDPHQDVPNTPSKEVLLAPSVDTIKN